jgi:hypothetical protein
MRKSWLFLTLVLLHLTPGTARATCLPGERICGESDPGRKPRPMLMAEVGPRATSELGPVSILTAPQLAAVVPAPPILVVTPRPADPDQQASQLYGLVLVGLASLVGAGFWMRARQEVRG